MTAPGPSAVVPLPSRSTSWWRSRGVELLALVALACITLTSSSSMATFTDAQGAVSVVAAARIFSGVRTSTAFNVRDASGGGAESDQSSPFAVAGDSLAATTDAWAAAFSAGRYVAIDLNAPLPAGILASGLTLHLRFASASPSGTSCVYAEARRISDDALEATYGSGGVPLACVTGTTPATLDQALAVIGSTDAANDLRIRIYGRDSAAAGSTIDQAVVTGSTAYAGFTLYPVRVTDAASGSSITAPWRLQGP